MNWKDIEKICAAAATKAIQELLAENSGQNIYTYALFTDDSAMSIGFGANTQDYFNKKLEAESDLTEEDFAYFKWNIAEWKYEGYKDDYFEDINKKLTDLSLTSNRDELNILFDKVINIMVNSLKHAREKHINQVNQAVFFVTVTDDEFSEKIENYSAKILNPGEISNNFLSRYNK